jgi:glycosyltransferase involved in cell wall biosynthesis
MKRQLHLVVFFINVGFYHAARLRAAAIACDRLGWRLTAVQLTDDTLAHPWGHTEQDIGFPLVTLMPKADGLSSVEGLPQVSQGTVEQCIESLKPDVIFLPGWSFDLSRKVLRCACRKNIPAVVMSESKRNDGPRFWWKERIKSWLYVRKFSAALVGSDLHAEYVYSLGISRQHIFKGYDAVDNDHFREAAAFAQKYEQEVRAKYPKMPQKPFFIVVLRLMPRKNVLRLLDAYIQYRSNCSEEPWDMVICGEGEQRKALEDAIRDNCLEASFHLVGFLTYQEVGHWYGLAAAFIHPALKEQWGLVVNEACAAGLPILCSQTVGSCHDLVREGENGYLFDPTSVTEIARCLLGVHAAGQDARDWMGHASQNLVESCSPDNFGNGVISAARAVCSLAADE